MRTTSQTSSLAARTPAALTAGLLALSAVLPPVAFAEQDHTDDGTADVIQNASTDPDQGGSFDPGGDAASLPDAAPPTATASPTPLAAPDAVDQADPVVDPGDGSDAKSATPPVAPAATAAPTAPAEPQLPTEPQAPSAPPADAPAADATAPAPVPVPAGAPGPPVPVAPAVTMRRVKRVHRLTVRHRLSASHPVHTPTVAARVPEVAAARSEKAKTVSISAALRAKPGDRTHTVQPGECLWIIATDVMGSRATSTVVAREVHRLWIRNSVRIGTGDPDLLLIGTKLTLT